MVAEKFAFQRRAIEDTLRRLQIVKNYMIDVPSLTMI